VPAGDYRQVWRTRDTILTSGQTGYEWFAPEIGLVRSEYGYTPFRHPERRAVQIAVLTSVSIK